MNDLLILETVLIKLGVQFEERVDRGWGLPEEFYDIDDFPIEVVHLNIGCSVFFFSLEDHNFLGWADLEYHKWHPKKQTT